LYPEQSTRAICYALGYSRQAYYKHLKNAAAHALEHVIIIKMINEIRKDMPRIGGRKLFHLLQAPLLAHNIDIGRDKFFSILDTFGLLVRIRKKRKPITTDSNHPFYKYPNLIKQMDVVRPNQLWVSDITYISLINKFCYLSLITDAYSHKIVGYCLWENLKRDGTMNALKMATAGMAGKDKSRLVHHSDRGLQYCSKDYIDLLVSDFIGISMTENGDPYENAIAERVNGILKGEFALGQPYKGFDLAHEAVVKGINTYNAMRPHASCDYLTPDAAHQTTGKLKSKWRKKDVQPM
jgi:transposase InsO family protein